MLMSSESALYQGTFYGCSNGKCGAMCCSSGRLCGEHACGQERDAANGDRTNPLRNPFRARTHGGCCLSCTLIVDSQMTHFRLVVAAASCIPALLFGVSLLRAFQGMATAPPPNRRAPVIETNLPPIIHARTATAVARDKNCCEWRFANRRSQGWNELSSRA